MNDMEQAKNELDRIQEIIARHEGHMATLRGWLLAIIGGLLAGFYTENIEIGPWELRVALLGITALFLWVETRHVNLIDAVIERSIAVEEAIQIARRDKLAPGWYNGPKVAEACRDGATRGLLPENKMTWKLNLPFYLVVIIVIGLTVVELPQKSKAAASTAAPLCCSACAKKTG